MSLYKILYTKYSAFYEKTLFLGGYGYILLLIVQLIYMRERRTARAKHQRQRSFIKALAQVAEVQKLTVFAFILFRIISPVNHNPFLCGR